MKGKKHSGAHMKKMRHASKMHEEGHKKGGMVKAKKKMKHVGKAEGHKAKHRLDKKARGGSIKEAKGMGRPDAEGMTASSPMSAATKTEKLVEGEKEVMKRGGRLTAAKRKK